MLNISDKDIEKIIKNIKNDKEFKQIFKELKRKRIIFFGIGFLLMIVFYFFISVVTKGSNFSLNINESFFYIFLASIGGAFIILQENKFDLLNIFGIIFLLIIFYLIFPFILLYIVYLYFVDIQLTKKISNNIKDIISKYIVHIEYYRVNKNNRFPLKNFFQESALFGEKGKKINEEDFIRYKNDSIKLLGEEVTLKIKDLNGSIYFSHSYLIYIEILDHRFPIKNRVIIKPDLFNSIKKGSINFEAGLKETINYFGKKVNLESNKFEEIFDVESENEIETRRLLTPKMMEKLVKLKQDLNLDNLSISFFENKVYIKIGIPSNFLDININLLTNIDAELRTFLNQIKLILDFVNYLNIEYFSQNEFSKNKK